ncbi:MAG: TlpA disulfide reductase family protein [Gammaproteobacteria bacterium]
MPHNFSRFSVILFALFALSTTASAAVDFTLPDINGVPHKLSDYRGKWVVVNYWATWCGPCLQEIPVLEEFHAKHKDKDAIVLGVNAEDISIEDLREFIDEHFISYPMLLGDTNDQSPLGPIYGLPSTFMISPAGEIAAFHLGSVTAAALEEFIKPETAGHKQKISDSPKWKFWKRKPG